MNKRKWGWAAGGALLLALLTSAHAQVNQPPQVSFRLSTAASVQLTAPSTGTLSVNASDADGSVSKVEYYRDGALIGSSTTSPYRLPFSFQSGTYQVVAKAYDNAGGVTATPPLTISVVPLPTQWTKFANEGQTVGLPGTQTVRYGSGSIWVDKAFSGSVQCSNAAFGVDPLPGLDKLCVVATSALASNAPPVVTISSPPNGSAVTSPMTGGVVVAATDNDGAVTKVEVYMNGALIATSGASTVTVGFNVPSAGTYQLQAKAYDVVGAVASSPVVNINAAPLGPDWRTIGQEGQSITLPAAQSVRYGTGTSWIEKSLTGTFACTNATFGADPFPAIDKQCNVRNVSPVVSLVSPFAGLTYSAAATVALSAAASDSDGSVAKVEYYDGAALIGASTTAPYTLGWSNMAVGVHSVAAKAYDNLGAVSSSAPIQIAVQSVPVSGWKTVLLEGQSMTLGTYKTVRFGSGLKWVLKTVTGAFTCTNATFTDPAPGVVKQCEVEGVNSAPTVALATPQQGLMYGAPANIAMSAVATDQDGPVSKVEYYNGPTLLGTSTAAPFAFNWSAVPVGRYPITAKAFDPAGAVTTSAVVFIDVVAMPATGWVRLGAEGQSLVLSGSQTVRYGSGDRWILKPLSGTISCSNVTFTDAYPGVPKVCEAIPNNVAPTVSLTAPAANASYTAPAAVTIAATAADSDGTIAKVEYYNGATLLGTSTAAPYSFTWSNVAVGSYSLTAKAYDNAGAAATSAAVAITVKAANVAPTVSLTGPAANANYAAPASLVITATAADSDGTIAKVEYYNGTTLLGTSTAAPYYFAWSNVAVGSYSLTAKATDNNGAVSTSAAVAITVKAVNVAPTVSLLAPTANATFTAPANMVIIAEAGDADGSITRVEFYNGTTLLGANFGNMGPFGQGWNNVPAGTYSLTAKAYDNLGGVTTSAAVAITVKAANAAPTVSLTAPAANASYTAPAAVTITANAADSDGTIAKVEYYNGTTLLGTSTAAPYSYTWSNLTAGSYSLTAKATDNTGAVTTSAAVAITVKAANVAPTVSLTAPAANASYTAPAAVTITATAADSDGTISKVEYYNGATLLGTSTAAPYSFTWSNVAVGSYTLTAKATDNTGAVTTSAAVDITVKAANAAPTVNLTAPAANASYAAPVAVTITANAADSDGTIVKVEYYNGTTLLGTSTAAPYSFTWSNVAAGSYSLTAKATDNTGAVTTSAAVAITVKAATVSPTVSLTAPTANAVYTGPVAVTITATASDSDGTIAKVEYYNGATLLGTSTAAPYSYTWSNVAAGVYSLTAKATDNAGASTTSAAVSITVNPGAMYFIHTDHLGTPRLIADQAKKTVWRWENQEPFGQTGLQEDPDADGKPFTFNLRFAGQYYDQESGLHYNRNRDYDPATGRYVQADPIGLSGGISLYSYVSGNPLSFIDPLGLAKCDSNGGGTTEPTLPPKQIAEGNGVKVEHYYRSDDHAPAHAHVVGGGRTTRIGANGKPLAGDPELTSAQRAVVDENRSAVRKSVNKIGRWLDYKEGQ